ncbi:MAG: LytTR family transcriptional regulator [Eubacterium sp.]|nr:LytTR family transcriptional regulator [Eubacterium sp.]MBR0412215.1 LytTR family transcriptional regulator [Eubacterium sp.]
MADKIKVELIIDGAYTEPEVTIRAGKKSELTDRIIEAIEGAAEAEFSSIPAYSDGKLEFVKQRDIMRIRTEGRQIALDTESRCYIVRQTLTQLEEELER